MCCGVEQWPFHLVWRLHFWARSSALYNATEYTQGLFVFVAVVVYWPEGLMVADPMLITVVSEGCQYFHIRQNSQSLWYVLSVPCMSEICLRREYATACVCVFVSVQSSTMWMSM